MSHEHPWMKFWPRDWRGDQALRAVSMAARGFWMECICIMHEAKPYGHLVLNGMPVEDVALARMTGISVDEVSALTAELKQAGVLSLTSRGVIFSRRMTRDHERSQKGKKAVSKRWTKPIEIADKRHEPIRLPDVEPITQKPEARMKKKDSCTKPPKGRLSYPPAFEDFWKAYPTDPLMSKLKTFQAWGQLDDEDRDKAAKAIPAFKTECKKRGPTYRTPHATTYLNERRFDGLLERRAIEVGTDRWGETPSVIEPAKDDFWINADRGPAQVVNGCAKHHVIAVDETGEA